MHHNSSKPRCLVFSPTHSQSNTTRDQHFTLLTLFPRAPLPITSHRQVQDELVYHVQLEAEHPDLSGFQDVTLQEITFAALTDTEQRTLQSDVEAGWPNDKAALPQLACTYWTFRHELT